jgi:hypothetical protein
MGVLFAASGCGDSDGASIAAPATVTVTAPATDTPATSASPTSRAPATTPTSTSGTTGPTATTAGGPLSSSAAGRDLTLNDFFDPEDYWTEARYDIADAKQVQGLAHSVFNCGSSNAQELELRLGNNFSQLGFSVGQSNDSKDSDQYLSVEIVGNNAQIDIQSVPFNEIRSFTVPVTGVNALKIRFWLDEKVVGCGGNVNVVLTDPVLT